MDKIDPCDVCPNPCNNGPDHWAEWMCDEAYAVVEGMKAAETSGKPCDCSMDVLMTQGCQCGGK